MILFSHPTGNTNVREAARALNEAGLLSAVLDIWVLLGTDSWMTGLVLRTTNKSVSALLVIPFVRQASRRTPDDSTAQRLRHESRSFYNRQVPHF